ncbi:MAG: energy transducer TonB [Paracoccaceae bacterium]
MQTGTKISATLHTGLVGAALFGGVFSSEPLPFEVQEVAVISVKEFEALSARSATPEVSPDPVALPNPDVSDAAPELDSKPDETPEVALPNPTEEPKVETTPVEPDPLPPLAEPDVPDVPGDLTAPDITEETATIVTPAQERPADRVAPDPVAAPPPDAAPDPVPQDEVAEDEGADEQQEAQDATAPEAAGTVLETEANKDDDVSVPMTSSIRPRGRPVRTAQPAEPQAETDTGSAVNDALAEALAEQPAAQPNAAEQAEVPSGPPLNQAEKDGLRVAVSKCWNVGSLSTDALQTTVVIGVSMSEDGKPDNGSIRMLSSSGGSDDAAEGAFEAARRAIIRCGSKGFPLPAEKYAQWRDIEMTFNPERMRIK